MATLPEKLDTTTPNIDVGIIITHSDYVTAYDKPFGHTATIIKAVAPGVIVYKNGENGAPGVWVFEAGEGWMIAADRILTSATINGTLRVTSVAASNILWAYTPSNIKPVNS